MGTGKHHIFRHLEASQRPIRVIGAAVAAIAVLPAVLAGLDFSGGRDGLSLVSAAIARDGGGGDGDGGNRGRQRFEALRKEFKSFEAPQKPSGDQNPSGGGQQPQPQPQSSGNERPAWTKALDEAQKGSNPTPGSASTSDGGGRGGDSGNGSSGNGGNGQSDQGQRPQKSESSGNADGANTSGGSNKGDRSNTTSRSSDDRHTSAKQLDDDKSFGAASSVTDWFKKNFTPDTPATAANPSTVSGAISGTTGSGTSGSDKAEPDKPDPSDKPVKTGNASPAAAVPNSTLAAAPAAKGTAANTGKTKAAVTAPPPAILPFQDKGTFKPREIVASNLGSAGIEKAKSRGFTAPAQSLFGNLGLTTVQRLIVPPGMSEADAYALLRQKVPSGNFAPNHVFRIVPAGEDEKPKTADKAAALAGTAPSACTGAKCFGQSLIGWKAENRACARAVRIGIIDTSYDLSHPAFAGQSFANGNFLGDGSTSPHDWHGTAVLGLLAGDARSGTPGLVPNAKFFLASAFRTDADGNASADTISVLNALSWLEKFDVKIINMSFSGPRDDLIEKAIGVMSQKGTMFVAAAGNGGPDALPSYPAAYPEVIAVTAVNQSMQGYRHASRGSYIDVAAPGVEVWTSLPNGKEGFRTGTSFAAPFFTGVLAAMPEARAGGLSKAQILSSLSYQDLGAPGRDPVYGEGLVKAPVSCPAPAEIARHPQQPASPKMAVGADDIRPVMPQPAAPSQAASGPSAR